MHKILEQSDNKRTRSEKEEQRDYCNLRTQQYLVRLVNLYNCGTLTANQYEEWHKKLTELPPDIEERSKYIQNLLKSLVDTYSGNTAEP